MVPLAAAGFRDSRQKNKTTGANICRSEGKGQTEIHYNLTVMKRQEYFCTQKKNTNNDFIQQFVSSVSFLENIRQPDLQIHVEDVSVWHRGDELLNKTFVYKNYPRCFIKYRLNHWWQMDYFDCFSDFSGPQQCYTWQSMGQSQASRFHPKYLIVFRGRTKLLRVWNDMGVKWLMTTFSFCGGVTL